MRFQACADRGCADPGLKTVLSPLVPGSLLGLQNYKAALASKQDGSQWSYSLGASVSASEDVCTTAV